MHLIELSFVDMSNTPHIRQHGATPTNYDTYASVFMIHSVMFTKQVPLFKGKTIFLFFNLFFMSDYNASLNVVSTNKVL